MRKNKSVQFRQRRNWSKRKDGLIENNISGNKNSICFQLQNFVTFDAKRVTKEDALLGSRSKLISIVRKCWNEAQTLKSSKIIIRWLFVEKKFIRAFDIKNFGRQLVYKINSCRNKISHKDKGKEDWNFRALATFKMCWYFLSTTTYCWGVSTQVN